MANPDGIFRLLVLAARADKTASAATTEVLFKYGAMMGLSQERMSELVEEAARGGKVPISVPTDAEERRELTAAVLDIICADKLVSPQQLAFLKRVLPMLGMRQDAIGPALNARLGPPPPPKR